MTADPDQNSHGALRWFPAAAALVTLVALAMRGIYLVGADTPIQIAGDIHDYVDYARNRGEYTPFAPVMDATFVVYVTLVHTILQAEPRYSIPYRPEQLLLAMSGLSLLSSATVPLIAWTSRRWKGNE